jgi:lipase
MSTSSFEAPVVGGSLKGWRSGSGPPALLLHGGPAMSEYLEGLAAELEGIFTCFRYQQRGLSPSVTDGDKSVRGHVADAVGVLDALSIQRAFLIGHSWGSSCIGGKGACLGGEARRGRGQR